MSDTAEDTRLAAAPTNVASYGHEPSFIAQPSTFLLPRGQNRAMQDKPVTAVDQDQLKGLVSAPALLPVLCCPLLRLPSCTPRSARAGEWGVVGVGAGLFTLGPA